ncbi:hypothetical protein PHYSODRAFT_308768 [Phytophthora sojae]|uniref:Monopolin complex subunit Csm1/Pcs1 C-terminal domain-containing protein n=1 Tax=Phytophthora sojae (strain P6497) TaxID=1094619 RepID=G4YF21_PHYSP|nr:hypothetical protein PHYSODRAFT_308768 [Phytophthora sojae]EGZ27604.1 hypothetical protein PHYSODRAFT_308768 [Phytophthora sojae]|eukprot:XP_009514879.1 hypothetical protein PHYSODRAFT_308768 [Phytophthora sojae]
MPSKKPAAVGDKKRGRPKKTDGPKKRRRRKSSWDYEDNDSDVEFEDDGPDDESDEEEQQQPPAKKKRGRPRKAPAAAEKVKKEEEKEKEKKEPIRRKKEVSTVPREEDEEQDRAALEEKHRSRKRQYELDSEQLLNEVRDLALAEKKTQEKLIEKLKRDVTTLSKQAEEERKKRKKEVDRIVADKMREFEAEQRKRDDADAEKAALRERIKELESQFASFKRSTGPDDVVTVNAAAASAATAMQNSEAILQLGQANKLLEIYRLVTSTDIRLIQSTDDDDQEGDDCTEIVCTTKDSATGNQFEFELAIPAIASSEIEYLPSEQTATGIHVPSYLRDELSFNRSEMTKFIRSVLDVVIRKKKV